MNDKEIKNKVDKIQEELNQLLEQNNLLIDISTYEMGRLSTGNYSKVKIKVYKEL